MKTLVMKNLEATNFDSLYAQMSVDNAHTLLDWGKPVGMELAHFDDKALVTLDPKVEAP